MGTTPFTIAVAFVASFALLGVSGCSKKSVQSGGDTQSQQGKTAKSESSESSRTGVGNFPDTSMQSGGGSGLRGLDKNPSEERIGAGNGMGAGSLLAKADTSDTAARQMDDIRAEQAASAAAGLRDVFFGYDSWTISDDQRQALNRDADWMKSNSSAMVKVEGHCDERGTTAYNLVLGEKRAKAVRDFLVSQGVSTDAVTTKGFGESNPVATNATAAGRQQNRRVELVVSGSSIGNGAGAPGSAIGTAPGSTGGVSGAAQSSPGASQPMTSSPGSTGGPAGTSGVQSVPANGSSQPPASNPPQTGIKPPLF